ncbi:hypothetical protein D3C81_1001590 [compost metagenome]
MLGILRDLLHRRAHLVHGGGHLVGFFALLADAQLGVFAAGRQLRGRLCQVADTLVDATDQLAQTQGHVAHAGLQLAHLVTAQYRLDLAQVALGDTRGQSQRLAQRLGDLQGDQPTGEHAHHQRQYGHAGQ